MPLTYVKLFFTFPEDTQSLTSAEKGRLVDALIRYARGEPVSLEGNERFLFDVFRGQIDREQAAYDELAARNRANGSRGGRPKKSVIAAAEPTGFSGLPNNPAAPKKKNKVKIIPPISPGGNDAQDGLSERFDRFWSAYPRKVAKQNAIRAWKKLCPDEALTRQILDAVERFKLDPQWGKDNGQFIPYPATFLNGHRWEDAPSEEPPPAEPRARQDVADLDSLYA